ncbi:bifunctional riboflavin kinase/FAD synthetase [Desulfoferrobacter suflitae]|uniref:bifunctional riboflavin kinase/FAD synthetase n=1 Tax=Desulfoferrobacter suflitae TaxID=2865782 RepID=UPI002164B274|nr:bifunctional riboflavin kinase/FAD synthetase [Desulfoferrobacter suflitae]MCK8600621.1 bifunctional riboflavin kinase/FAD synthetase [Desulfoferrobacter suflitae]
MKLPSSAGGNGPYMEVFCGIDQINRPLRNPVLTIGNFDGVHLGHQTLFDRVKHRAQDLGGESVVMTFHPHPLEVLSPGNGPVFITEHARKLRLIESCGIDIAIVIPFSREFARMSAQQFVKRILVEKIGVKALVVGYDYKFGHGREGDIEFLRNLGKKYAFDVEAVTGIKMDGKVVSSTAIRQCIQQGQLKEANVLLGRPYEISGAVVKGRDRGGRVLGFPTANIRLSCQAPPKTGVYAVRVEIDGKTYGGAANLGYNPTFGDTDLSLEVHIFDFNQDLYGKEITVQFVDRLRDEQRFAGPEELAVQIHRDIQTAREILTAAPRRE